MATHTKARRAKKIFYRRQPKPEWVRKEVIRLKALMPEAGCRAIANTFNRRFAQSKTMTVSKTFVNETVFTSWLFKFSLWLIGIRHQLIEKSCPWQNGKIERFFGTLKEKLDQWQVGSREQLNGALVQFRFWYNHIRPHQNLYGKTPAEVWSGIDVFTKKPKKEYWFEAWDGLLTGFYLKL